MDHKQRSDDLWGDAALFCVFVLALCLSLFKAYNRDLFWHLKTGQWILDNLQVPRSDFFSFSRAGMEWIDSQWLFQVILYKAYSWFGDSGFTFLQVFLTAGITALVVFSASRGLPRSVRALAGVLFLLAVNLRIDCRPELLSCFYMAAMFFVLERARHKNKKILLAIPLIQFLFVNSEGIWPIGIAITGAYLGDAVWVAITKRELSRWRSALAPWAVLFMATALIGLAQPYGVSGYLFPLTLLLEVFHESTVHKNVISEFKPIFSSSGLLRICLPFLFFTAVSLGCAIFSGKRIRPCLFMLGIIFTGLPWARCATSAWLAWC